MATHSIILAWEIPWTKETGGATVHGIAKNLTQLSDFHFIHNTYSMKFRTDKSVLYFGC